MINPPDPLHRFKFKRGEQLPQSKLTDLQVIAIRHEHRRKQDQIKQLNKQSSASAIAKKYNVHVRTIEKAIAGFTWSHVE